MMISSCCQAGKTWTTHLYGKVTSHHISPSPHPSNASAYVKDTISSTIQPKDHIFECGCGVGAFLTTVRRLVKASSSDGGESSNRSSNYHHHHPFLLMLIIIFINKSSINPSDLTLHGVDAEEACISKVRRSS